MTKARYVLVGVAFTLTALLFVDRIAISVAKGHIESDFGLTDTQFGWILSMFSLGYALFQSPTGAMADKWGPRSMLALFVIAWSALTGLTGLAIGFTSLLVARFLFGIAEAGAFPTFARAMYSWLPAGERALAQGINLSGARIGAAFALPFVAWMLDAAGWRESFYILCVAGILWALCWYLWFRNDPADHRSISKEELKFIEEGRETRLASADERVVNAEPVDMSFRSKTMWLLMLQYFAHSFTFYFALTWLFPYLQKTYGLSAVTTGFLAGAPLIASAIGNWVGGAVVDMLYRRGYGLWSRRLPAIIGFILSAGGLVGALMSDSAYMAVAWLCLAMFGTDVTVPPSWAYCIDVGGKKSGAVSGRMNMCGNLGAFLTSLAFPYMLAVFGSTMPFFAAAIVLNLIAAYFWFLIGSKRNSQSVLVKAS
ncbi:hypothetical protein BTJ39_00415 [Izhakiella australiensis]|uniref:Major facilitator superfamily (MFS) profile domain-containing protein n=1 Tax=Izhakiella australiensis TaxID=1926881 RepID=A0A1S8YS22_9GAMM|nr:MFS transporter [Izhakiella australiensis]OON41665.1 hypothetical protein BTJ39_00415 [Izhakiella australiensis]